MRLHWRISGLHMGWHDDGDGWFLATLQAAPFEGQAHRIRMRHIAGERVENGGLQFGSIAALEQAEQSGRDGAEIGTAFGGTSEQYLAGGCGLCELVGRAMLVGRVFFAGERFDMRGIFDLRTLVIAALMTGQHLCAIDDAHFIRIGEYGQDASHMIMPHRIIVQIEAYIGCFSDRHFDAFESWHRIVGQRQQAGGFLDKNLAHGAALRVVWALAIGGGA